MSMLSINPSGLLEGIDLDELLRKLARREPIEDAEDKLYRLVFFAKHLIVEVRESNNMLSDTFRTDLCPKCSTKIWTRPMLTEGQDALDFERDYSQRQFSTCGHIWPEPET